MNLKLAGDWAPIARMVKKLPFSSKLILNLEGPILEEEAGNCAAKNKAGPSLSNNFVPNVKESGTLIFANNHLMDFGVQGLIKSINVSRRYGWSPVGAGMSKSKAQAPVVFDWNGKKVGVLARCELQFGIATETRPGVAGFDAKIFEQIRRLSLEVDMVIISIHAAAEMVPWPSPRRQDTWRALIDAGADIVHGHHAHVPQGWEKYNGGFIFYGLGNFCVDPAKWAWHPNSLWSLAPEFAYEEGKIVMRPATAIIDDHGESISVRNASFEEVEKHQPYVAECNRPLLDRKLLEGLWQEASVRMYQDHYATWLGFNATIAQRLKNSVRSAINGLKQAALPNGSFFRFKKVSQRQYLLWYHLFACDSHSDAISTALGVLGGELEDLRTAKTSRMVREMMPGR